MRNTGTVSNEFSISQLWQDRFFIFRVYAEEKQFYCLTKMARYRRQQNVALCS
jgi:hypothetical protein